MGKTVQSEQARMSFPLKGNSCVGQDKDSSSHGNAAPNGESKARSGGSTIDAVSAGVPSVGPMPNAETQTQKRSAPKMEHPS